MNQGQIIDNEAQLLDESDHELQAYENNQKAPATSIEDSSGTCSGKRKLTSIVWQEGVFTQIKDEKGLVVRAQCKYCPKSYATGTSHGTSNLRRHMKNYATGTSHGTSNLRRHMKNCPGRERAKVDQLILGADAKIRSRIVSQAIYKEKLAMIIIKHNYPYAYVEHQGVRELHRMLNPDVKPVCVNTIINEVYRIHLNEKEKIKIQLAKVNGRICLTSDVWTSCTTQGYISLTAHFVDENWELCSRILNFTHMPPPHTGSDMAEKVYNLLKDWGIEERIFSITLDNVSANNRMEVILKDRLNFQNLLVLDGEYFHVRCCANILNLIVQDGLKLVAEPLKKIRDSVKYVTGSESRMLAFNECAKVSGINSKLGLRMDVVTRWNSTFLMLETALIYQKAFDHLKIIDHSYKYAPQHDEWGLAFIICEFLKPFEVATRIFSGSEYVTANLYFQIVWRIQMTLEKAKVSSYLDLSLMASEMSNKFNKYWDSFSDILSIAAVLDPRHKMGFIEYCYGKLDPSTAAIKILHVKEKLERLFNEYAAKVPGKQSANTPIVERNSSTKRKRSSVVEITSILMEDSIVSA